VGCYYKINCFCAVDHSHSPRPNDEFPLNSAPIFLKTAFANQEFREALNNSSLNYQSTGNTKCDFLFPPFSIA